MLSKPQGPPPRDPRHELGLAGEAAAQGFLRSRGWTIEAHRFRFGRHDLDIVARRGDVVAFVEVKCRSTGSFGPPAEAVTWRKRQILATGARWWQSRFGRAADRYRFDVIAVYEGGGPPRIEHLEDAWRPG